MAIASTAVWEVRTTGSDALNGGAFDPGQTAGMLADGAATVATGSSPVFTSATYSFVAGDVGAWVYVASGTNWLPGWYKIASVAGNAATLAAGIGAGVTTNPVLPSTALGCATTASPTGATWTIDYSQRTAAARTYSDLTSTGAGLTVMSVAFPFAKQMVGNGLIVASGANFTPGVYVVASVAAGVATLLGGANATTGVGASGVGGLGGCFATLAKACANATGDTATQNKIWATGAFSVSATATISDSSHGVQIAGYGTVRGDGVQATFTATANVTILLCQSGYGGLSRDYFANLDFNGNSQGAASVFAGGGAGQGVRTWSFNCTYRNGLGAGFDGLNSVNILSQCWSHHNSGYGFGAAAQMQGCAASNNGTGFSSASGCVRCLAANNGGYGFAYNQQVEGWTFLACTSAGNGADGFAGTRSGYDGSAYFTNCLSYGNTGYGFGSNQTGVTNYFNSCYAGGNTSGSVVTGFAPTFPAALTAAPFANAAGAASATTLAALFACFAPNATAGGGAAIRAAGDPASVDVGAVQHADPAGGGGAGVSFFGGFG